MVHAQCHQQRQDLKKAQKEKEYLHGLSHCILDCALCKLILTQLQANRFAKLLACMPMVASDSVRDAYPLVF